MPERLQLCDAHNHLQDRRLRAAGLEIDSWIQDQADYCCVVNGTEEDDWEEVARLAGYPQVYPAYGLHPWRLHTRKPGWEERLRRRLVADPRAGVGEVGLDRARATADMEAQLAILRTHLELATELNRPLTIHCLQAWGPLLQVLQAGPLPARGFLLHAYAGSAEMVDQLVELGAYFSFSPAFANPKRKRTQSAFNRVPEDRLLLETDAPSMPPPRDRNPNRLESPEGESTRPLNHPANLTIALESLANLRQVPAPRMAQVVQVNFLEWLGMKNASFAGNR